jgi:hypothetical protein
VIEVQPGRSFAFRWGSGKGETTVRFTLEPHGLGTMVWVTESGYSHDEDDLISCLDCACGWGEALTLLEFYLEHGVTYGRVPARSDGSDWTQPDPGSRIPLSTEAFRIPPGGKDD